MIQTAKKVADFTGLKYLGNEVLKRTGKSTKSGHSIYLVKCKCGKLHEKPSRHLTKSRRGPIKACDCNHPWNYTGLTKKDQKLRKLYDITESDWHRMLKEQDGKCLICGSKEDEKLHVDHCHETGKVRGLLCKTCNVCLGLLDEDPVLFERCIEYLSDHTATHDKENIKCGDYQKV